MTQQAPAAPFDPLRRCDEHPWPYGQSGLGCDDACRRAQPHGSVPANNITALASSGSSSQAISIQWPCNGFIVAIRATVRASSNDNFVAGMSSTLLRVQVDGTDELFPSAAGGGAGFIPFSQISGAGAFLGRYAVRRKFLQTTYWNIFVNNTTASTLVCDVSFDYINTSNPRV